jgi:hypothetical protein
MRRESNLPSYYKQNNTNMNNINVSKKILIKRKPIPGIPGLDESMRNRKIGATIYKGVYPLSQKEKEEYMPQLLGISKTSERFEGACQEYFNNISVPVPPNGLELEIGFTYKSIEDRDREKEEDYVPTPIDVSDYVLYKHCLVYGKVANSPKDVNKSNRIEFFIEDESENKAEKDKANKKMLNVMQLIPPILNDNLKVKQVISVANEQIPESIIPKLVNSVDIMDNTDLSLRMFELAKAAPDMLTAIIKDKTLDVKYLLTKAIEVGIVRKIPNTTTLVFSSQAGDITLGNNLSETISILKQEKYQSIFTEIKAKLITERVVKNIEDVSLEPVPQDVKPKPQDVKPKPQPNTPPQDINTGAIKVPTNNNKQ